MYYELTREAGRGASAQRVYDVDNQPVCGRPHGHCPGAHQEGHGVEQVGQVASHIQAVVK